MYDFLLVALIIGRLGLVFTVGELMATGHLRMHLCLVMKGYIWAWLVFRSRFLLRFGCVHEIAGAFGKVVRAKVVRVGL